MDFLRNHLCCIINVQGELQFKQLSVWLYFVAMVGGVILNLPWDDGLGKKNLCDTPIVM